MFISYIISIKTIEVPRLRSCFGLTMHEELSWSKKTGQKLSIFKFLSRKQQRAYLLLNSMTMPKQ